MAETTFKFRQYESEEDLPDMIALIEKDLSEPYSVFTYRYFVSPWPQLAELCFMKDRLVGVVVCKADNHKSGTKRGYIGMLAVAEDCRGHGIARTLVETIIKRMEEMGLDECVLEAEITNQAALGFYRKLGFVRTKRLRKYYLTGRDAFRLKLLVK